MREDADFFAVPPPDDVRFLAAAVVPVVPFAVVFFAVVFRAVVFTARVFIPQELIPVEVLQSVGFRPVFYAVDSAEPVTDMR
ncbi:hypothetical protein, partial [Streptomyces griseus]|uniref:hypothetical protein n=1 Tax=Streptomyces griseus TaxID=1911 RepID=UPI0036CF1F26